MKKIPKLEPQIMFDEEKKICVGCQKTIPVGLRYYWAYLGKAVVNVCYECGTENYIEYLEEKLGNA